MPPKKKQKLEKLDKPTCLHTCNKTSFAKAFLPNEIYRQRLLDYIAMIHQLADHASHTLKFYILSAPSFTVNEETIEAILYLLNKGEAWQPKTDAKRALRECLLPYVRQYCHIVGFVHPNLKVNVQEHFMQMILRYINLRLDVKGRKGQFPPKSEARKAFFARLRYLKSVFLFETMPESLDDLSILIAIDAMSFLPAYCKLSRSMSIMDFDGLAPYLFAAPSSKAIYALTPSSSILMFFASPADAERQKP